MAVRARNIKPGFFLNETLGEADPLYSLIFAGLWCMCDREGRLEDRPARIHACLNPYRPRSSTVQALDWVVHAGFVRRYEVAGQSYLQVVNFRSHQQPHMREPPSKIPAPENHDNNQEDVEAPDEHGSSTGLAPDKHRSGPSDSGFRIPKGKRGSASPSKSKNGANGHDDEASKVYSELIASGGAKPKRTAKIQDALDAAGGWSAIKLRTEFNAEKIRQAFLDAYRSAA